MHVALAAELGKLLADPGGNDTGNLIVTCTLADGVAEAPPLLPEEAVAQLAVRGQAQPVAAAAEGVGHAGDDAEAPRPAWDAPEARDVVGRVWGQPPGRLPAPALEVSLHGLEDAGLRHQAVGAPAVAVEGHELQEAHLQGQALREVHEGADLVLVHAPEEDAIDLQREGVLPRYLFERLHDPSMPRLRAAGQQGELGRHERVQAEVHAPHPGLAQLRQEPLQPDAVRGQAEGQWLRQAGTELPQVLYDAGEVAADRWLPAGEPHLSDAQAHEEAGEAPQLLRRQQVTVLVRDNRLLVVPWHAVLAPKVTAIRQ
mmetsp:Transcript_125649/g.367065  ORF Transcript_125649/g.367065 Transcript_125649/m.367065 type:complete len:314 (+) Transcript_125649:132-1073(+)